MVETNELTPRDITWEILRSTKNAAAIAVLGESLRTATARVRSEAVKTLFARREDLAYRQIILDWEACKAAALPLAADHRPQLDACTRDLMESGSLAEKRLAIEVINALKLTTSLKSLLAIALEPRHALQAQAAKCVLELCSHWGNAARRGTDKATLRTPMLETLYGYLIEYSNQRNTMLLDAWLALVHWDDAIQRGILADPGGNIYQALLERISSHQEPFVIQLLAGYVARTTTPASLLEILCQCDSPKLAEELAAMVDTPAWTTAKRRLRELPTLQCLKRIGNQSSKNFDYERRIWTVISYSSDDMHQVLNGALRLAKLGSAEGRKTACEVIKNCRIPSLDSMVSELQAVQAGIAPQGSLGTVLMEISHWSTSPSTALQQAAVGLFREFTIQNLMTQLPKWPTTMCRAMAQIVRLFEKNLTDFLAKELQSPAPKRRLAALQATHMLELPEAVSQFLLPMLEDPRLEVRVQVIDLLSELGTNLMDELLPQWLNDASSDIQDAARRAVRRRERRAKTQETEVSS